MTRTMTYEPAEQAKRRRRARVTQEDMARLLGCAISKISEYETGKKPLPWQLTPEDYERALERAIRERGDA